MKKKTLSLILALLMVFSLLPASAFAANVVQSGTCGENLTWTLDDEGVLTITGTGEMTESPWLSYKDSIKTVVIGEGVTSLCGAAFIGCTGITKATLPSSLKTIGYASFCDCTELTSINIPGGVKEIANSAFSGCTGLKSVSIPNSVDTIEFGAFSNCEGLTGISIPSSVKTIETEAFSGCAVLAAISIPGSVTYIGSGAFSGCIALKSADIKGAIPSLQSAMFSGCSSLESVSFPNSVKSIGMNAFYGCDVLKDVYFIGTDMQWAVMDIKEGNEALDLAEIHFALDYPFTDIADSGYRYYISLGQAVGIVNGYPDGTFRPSNSVTRAQYITMLYNMFGKPDVSGLTLDFKDKNSISGSYLNAVKWGVALGIINGYDDNTFRPDQEITRAQMAAFSYRLMARIAGEEAPDNYKKPCGFKDEASIANVYKEAVNVCANTGIITGFDTNGDGKGDTFRPDATANRGQAATIIVRVAISLGGSE